MGPEDFLIVVLLCSLTLYALLGGADFGAGIWEFTTALQSSSRERNQIYKAIGPVWEANHVWLIFVLVIIMNGFPLAFAALSRALWLPLLLALFGILFRGASYAFRSYSASSSGERTIWEAIFALTSTCTPLFLGASAGAIASGQLAVTASGNYTGDYIIGWISPLSIFCGFYSVGLCAYLAAVYLARESFLQADTDLTTLWRQRSLTLGLWMGLCSIGGLLMVFVDAPLLSGGFLVRGWILVGLSVLCGIGSLIALWHKYFTSGVIFSGGAVAMVIWGWGLSQYPVLIPPLITIDASKAPEAVLWMMLFVISIGAIFLFPSLGYLFYLFKSSRQQR